MSKARVNRSRDRGLTTWYNATLAPLGEPQDSQVGSIAKSFMAPGRAMMNVVQATTGKPSKRIRTLEESMSSGQRQTRVDWMIDELVTREVVKREDLIISNGQPIEAKYVARCNAEHLLKLLWCCASHHFGVTCGHLNFDRPRMLGAGDSRDDTKLQNSLPSFKNIVSMTQKSASANIKSSERTDIPKLVKIVRLAKKTTGMANRWQKKAKIARKRKEKGDFSVLEPHELPAVKCVQEDMIDCINWHIARSKIRAFRYLRVKTYHDLRNPQFLCLLVNCFLPKAFTVEALPIDRWSLMIAIRVLSSAFRLDTRIDAEDFYEGDPKALCAFFCGFFRAGAHVRNVMAVHKRIVEIETTLLDEEKSEAKDVARLRSELKELEDQWDLSDIKSWNNDIAKSIEEGKKDLSIMQANRYEVLEIGGEDSTTINDFCERNLINLSLTQGLAFFSSDKREKVWADRKIILQNLKTGEFFDDDSDVSVQSTRNLLGLHETDSVLIDPARYSDFRIYFESSSGNRILKPGQHICYQVFPGSSSQVERIIQNASSKNQLKTLQSLLQYYGQRSKVLINARERKSGNSALHFAARNGHISIAEILLQNGAEINARNLARKTPFFLAVDSQHRMMCQLLIEWGANVDLPRSDKVKPLESLKNPDMFSFLEFKIVERRVLLRALQNKGDSFIIRRVQEHISKENTLCSLNSWVCNIGSLMHVCALQGYSGLDGEGTFCCIDIIKAGGNARLLNSRGQTALHCVRCIDLARQLIKSFHFDVNAVDHNGNTPLHEICEENDGNVKRDKNKDGFHPYLDLVGLYMEEGAWLDIKNNKGMTAAHLCASAGMTDGIIKMLAQKTVQMHRLPLKDALIDNKFSEWSLSYLAARKGYIKCAAWCAKNGLGYRQGECDSIIKIAFCDRAWPPEGSDGFATPRPIFLALLLDHMMDVSDVDCRPNIDVLCGPLLKSPLLLAVQEGSFDLLRRLVVDYNASIDMQDSDGNTALHYAVKNDDMSCAVFLLKNGADVELRNQSGVAALEKIRNPGKWEASGHFNLQALQHIRNCSIMADRELVREITDTMKIRGATKNKDRENKYRRNMKSQVLLPALLYGPQQSKNLSRGRLMVGNKTGTWTAQ
eukprot:UC4_evm8s1505